MADRRAVSEGGGPSQRRRTGSRHHPSEYIPGAVMKVKLHNFMTYSDVEMEPGPRLNVILGPNGTGKSSFVCALAIGLAGATKLLGRADKIAEFVKRGEESGYSEITLATKDPSRPMVVRREIKRKDGSSAWRVNGAPVNLERVKAEMDKLGVQLDNLCQFLPQDRVVEFARMTPEQLLQETEKAIGNAELYDMHKTLIDKKDGIADLEREAGAANNIERAVPPRAKSEKPSTPQVVFLSVIFFFPTRLPGRTGRDEKRTPPLGASSSRASPASCTCRACPTARWRRNRRASRS